MKIAVLGGSPKGDVSVTMQYVRFIQKMFPQHELEIIQVSSRIARCEKDPAAFDEVIDAVRRSDGVLWAFPLYYLLVPSQYKRFIELIFERGAGDAFSGKYAGVLTTSIHFCDHTAHNYMRAVSEDLGMRFAGSFSPGMFDLQKPEGHEKTRQFAEEFFLAIEGGLPTTRAFPPIQKNGFSYSDGTPDDKVDAAGKKVVVLHDARDQDRNLSAMIDRLKGTLSGDVTVHNLRDVKILGGCLGCLKCSQDNICAYEGKDEYIEFFRREVVPADVIVFAGSVVDRNLSSRWRMFFDRSFFNTHIPQLLGKQLAFLISGPLGQVPNMRQMLEAYGENQGANVVDFVTDEGGDAAELDALISALAARAIRMAERGYVKPPSFFQIGGRKIFRDEVFADLRFVFQADHRWYRKNGRYDFPNKRVGQWAANLLTTQAFRIPRIRREFDKRIKKGLVSPLEKVVEKVGQRA